MKRIVTFLILCLSFGFATAQTIAVTATITDSDGQTWNNGTFSVVLFSPNGAPFYNGTPVSTVTQKGNLSSSGALAVSLNNTNTITPGGAQYQWTICSNTSAPCSQFLAPVTSTNLSTLLSSLVTAPRFAAGPTAFGYLDIEASPIPPPGGGYFNVTLGNGRVWNGTAWVNSGGGGGVSSINGVPGAFTFSGGVTCTTTTCLFSSNTSTTYKLVSQLGCAYQNTNLNSGGGTDDTTCINNALSLATSSHPVTLIQDGASLIHGIAGPATGNWGIEGIGGGVSNTGTVSGTGFYLANGSTVSAIQAGSTSCADASGTAPARNVNVFFKDFVLNGNGPNNPAYCYGIDVANMEHVNIENVTFYLVGHYSLRLENVGLVVIDGSKFEPLAPTDTSDPLGAHTDGVHVDGPANDIAISNSYFHTGDDAIALNAPEGYSGLITRVAITNSTVFDSFSMLRLYPAITGETGGTAGIDTVNISNYSGDTYGYGLVIGVETNTTLTGTDPVTNVTWDNSSVKAPTNVLLDGNVGTMGLHYDWTPQGGISYTVCHQCGYINQGTASATVGTLDLSNASIVQASTYTGQVAGMMDSENCVSVCTPGVVTYNNVIANNVNVKTELGTTPGSILVFLYLNPARASVGNFTFNSTSGFTLPYTASAFSPTTFVTSASGPQSLYTNGIGDHLVLQGINGPQSFTFTVSSYGRSCWWQFGSVCQNYSGTIAYLTTIPITMQTYTVATLPSSSIPLGTMVIVTDSTGVPVCTGGGTSTAIGLWNGASWRCITP